MEQFEDRKLLHDGGKMKVYKASVEIVLSFIKEIDGMYNPNYNELWEVALKDAEREVYAELPPDWKGVSVDAFLKSSHEEDASND